MAARGEALRLVIYDCDGVLVDSEGIANRVVSRSLSGLGWPMTEHEADAIFLGMSITDMIPVIETRLGRGLPDDWMASLTADLVDSLARDVTAIPGAVEALRATSALGLPWRVASNSSHDEMRAKFARLGVTDMVAGRVHSFLDVARGKPAPDVFLAAAAAEGVSPGACVVIEDSPVGVRAAVAAGMDCLAYVPRGDDTAFRALGATPFRVMAELPALFAMAMKVTA